MSPADSSSAAASRVSASAISHSTTAAREGLHGWVRNLPDGRVEAAAEGEAEAVERFEQALRHGPPGARVEHLEIEHTVPDGRDTGFTIT